MPVGSVRVTQNDQRGDNVLLDPADERPRNVPELEDVKEGLQCTELQQDVQRPADCRG